jgi:hypothetical protein
MSIFSSGISFKSLKSEEHETALQMCHLVLLKHCIFGVSASVIEDKQKYSSALHHHQEASVSATE